MYFLIFFVKIIICSRITAAVNITNASLIENTKGNSIFHLDKNERRNCISELCVNSAKSPPLPYQVLPFHLFKSTTGLSYLERVY